MPDKWDWNRKAAWRSVALSETARLEGELAAVTTSGALADHARGCLSKARARVESEVESPRSWWTGHLIEGVWSRLRQAETDLVCLSDDVAKLHSLATRAQTDAARVGLTEADPARKAVREFRTAVAKVRAGSTAPDDVARIDDYRFAIKELFAQAHRVSAEHNQIARQLRNQYLGVWLVLSVVTSVLGGAAWILDSTFGLPTPDGWEATDGALVPALLAAGGLGGLVGGIELLKQSPTFVGTQHLAVPQALAMVAFGTLAGVIGVVALDGFELEGIETDIGRMSMVVLFGLAIALGYAQRVVIGVLDKRADLVLEERTAGTAAS